MKHSLAFKNIPLFLLILISGFLLFITRSAYQSGDSLSYALIAKSGGGEMFHPHHFIFTPVMHVFYKLNLLFSKKADIMTIGQIHNIFWAILTIISTYFITFRLKQSRSLAFLTALILLFTQGVLAFTTWFEVYIPALGCLAILSVILIYQNRNNRLSISAFIFLSLMLALSVLYHQTNVLIVIPLGFYFIISEKRLIREWITILIFSGMFVFLLYLFVYIHYNYEISISGFIHYCLSYTSYPNPEWGTLNNISLQGIKGILNNQVWNIASIGWRFKSLEKLLFLGIFTIILGWNIWKAIKEKNNRDTRIFLIAWIFIYYGFFWWWLPSEKEFFLATLFPLGLLGFFTIEELFNQVFKYHAKRYAVVLFSLTSIFLIYNNLPAAWQHHQHQGVEYDRAEALSDLLIENPVIICPYGERTNLQYHRDYKNTYDLSNTAAMFYEGNPLPETILQAVNESKIISIHDLKPDISIFGYNGYSHPDGYLAFIKWLFSIEDMNDGSGIRYCDFTLHPEKIVNDCLIISTQKDTLANLSELLGKLDQLNAIFPESNTSAFSDWYHTSFK